MVFSVCFSKGTKWAEGIPRRQTRREHSQFQKFPDVLVGFRPAPSRPFLFAPTQLLPILLSTFCLLMSSLTTGVFSRGDEMFQYLKVLFLVSRLEVKENIWRKSFLSNCPSITTLIIVIFLANDTSSLSLLHNERNSTVMK